MEKTGSRTAGHHANAGAGSQDRTLVLAVQAGDTDSVTTLLEAGHDPNALVNQRTVVCGMQGVITRKLFL